jgi:hypothetical protein
MKDVLEAEDDVDLVIITGDIVSGWLGKGQLRWVEDL